MSDPSKPTPPNGFNLRSVLYALIPIGFIAIVLALVLGGEVEQATDDDIVEGIEEGE
ncbi:nicotinate phosphoribosyltransferase [Yoonia sp. 208BN28-4]|uniref:nicotinate phosphoribosyltransferase n=1 Tax=Yoonia sp. 208BN28-4 TaxID=3126505 RepID=UPI0030A57E75